jgi:peptide/nickel transport system ATP-binding protein
VDKIVIKKLMISTPTHTLVDLEDIEFEKGLALVGASGSGKSMTLKGIIDLVDEKLTTTCDIVAPFECVRGKSVAFVPQNPFTALSPLTKIRDQFFSPIEKIEKMFDRLGLKKEHLNGYPSELSGGQLQRVVLGMALLDNPKLLLLDEPTTALDRETKLQMITLVKELQDEFGFAIIFVTHEIALAPLLCPKIAIIDEGKVVEYGESHAVVSHPQSHIGEKLMSSDFTQRNFRQ